MIARIWQKLGIIILIIACLFNVTIKIIKKISLDEELRRSAEYVKSMENEENKN